MLNRPLLSHANVIPFEDDTISDSFDRFILRKYGYGEYHYYFVDGARTEFSVYRLVGGCNHLSAFNKPGCEKSEDYDKIPSFHYFIFSKKDSASFSRLELLLTRV